MNALLQNPNFIKDLEALQGITLNPARHTSKNAQEHALAVAEEAARIAQQNGCSQEEADLLSMLGLVHDIGKISGSANAQKSVDLLPHYGLNEPRFVSLVQHHDVNLPWWISSQKGEPPSDKAWRRLASKVDMRLLCLFMVADRVDCPGGWRANRPLLWFLAQAQERGFLPKDLNLPPSQEETPTERCAGGVIRRGQGEGAEALVMRVRKDLYELPKGHIEPKESPENAAAREIFEETGLSVEVGPLLGNVEYPLHDIIGTKEVQYFFCQLQSASEPKSIDGGPELRWIRQEELSQLGLVNEALRPLLQKGFLL